MLCIFCFRLSDKINENELLRQLREDKKLTWIAGQNERFKGKSFGDAKVISGSAHKLRPDTIPLAKPPSINISIPMSYNFTDRYKECDFGVLVTGNLM